MTAAIYAKNFDKAKKKLEDIIYWYSFKCYQMERQYDEHNEIMAVQFDNGDTWMAMSYNPSRTCGRRYNIVYIDKELTPDEELNIKLCLTNPPFQAYNYF